MRSVVREAQGSMRVIDADNIDEMADDILAEEEADDLLEGACLPKYCSRGFVGALPAVHDSHALCLCRCLNTSLCPRRHMLAFMPLAASTHALLLTPPLLPCPTSADPPLLPCPNFADPPLLPCPAFADQPLLPCSLSAAELSLTRDYASGGQMQL